MRHEGSRRAGRLRRTRDRPVRRRLVGEVDARDDSLEQAAGKNGDVDMGAAKFPSALWTRPASRSRTRRHPSQKSRSDRTLPARFVSGPKRPSRPPGILEHGVGHTDAVSVEDLPRSRQRRLAAGASSVVSSQAKPKLKKDQWSETAWRGPSWLDRCGQGPRDDDVEAVPRAHSGSLRSNVEAETRRQRARSSRTDWKWGRRRRAGRPGSTSGHRRS